MLIRFYMFQVKNLQVKLKCVQKGYILVIQNYFYILKLIWKIFANR